jgi:hypothetical protein
MAKITILKPGLDWLDNIRRDQETERDTILQRSTPRVFPEDEDPGEFYAGIQKNTSQLGISAPAKGQGHIRHTSAHPAIILNKPIKTLRLISHCQPMTFLQGLTSFKDAAPLTDENRASSLAKTNQIPRFFEDYLPKKIESQNPNPKTLHASRTRSKINSVPEFSIKPFNENIKSTIPKRPFLPTDPPAHITEYAIFEEFLNNQEFRHLKNNVHLEKKIQKLKNTVETKKNYISKVQKREIYVDSITNNILTNPNITMTYDPHNNSKAPEKSISISHLYSKDSQAKISLSSLPNIHLPPKLPILSKKSEN